jgi:hypothetical protein
MLSMVEAKRQAQELVQDYGRALEQLGGGSQYTPEEYLDNEWEFGDGVVREVAREFLLHYYPKHQVERLLERWYRDEE